MGGMDWIDLALGQGQMAGTCECSMTFRVPSNAGNYWTS